MDKRHAFHQQIKTNCLAMATLQAIPEEGICKYILYNLIILDNDTICDICMTSTASIFFTCKKHKICYNCSHHFSDISSCPFCKKLKLRYYERDSGKCYININHLLLHQNQSSSIQTEQSSLLNASISTHLDLSSSLSTENTKMNEESFWKMFLSGSPSNLSTESSTK